MPLENSFKDRKKDYYTRRGESVTRAAHLSPNITVVSFLGRGNRLSIVYDPLEVRAVTRYAGEVVGSVGFINDAAFAPGIIGFDEAMRVAQRMFVPFAGKNSAWYDQPQVTRDLPKMEKDRLYGVFVLKK